MTQIKFKQTEIGSIPVSWETYKLSDVVEIIGGGTPKTSVKEYWNGNIPWLSVVDFNGELRWINDTEKKITQKGLEKSSTKFLKKGQIIISARGTVGEIGQLGRDMAFNQSCYGLIAKEMLTNDFLYSLLKYNITQLKTKTHGSVFDTITRKSFEQITVAIPPISEQCEIAKILSDLDDKITLNTQINQTLESMAQAIFKSWFVDFEPVKAKIAAIEAGEDTESVNRAAMRAISGKTDDELDQMQAGQPDDYAQLEDTAELFPAAMWDSDLGEVPEGWGVKPFSEIIAINPKRKLSKGQNTTKIRMADIDCWQSWIERGREDKYKSGPKFQNGDILFARITPSLENGKTAYVNCLKDEEVGFGSTEFIVFGHKIILSSAYIYCLSRSNNVRETTIMEMTGTSGRQRVPNDCFDNLIIVNPPENIVRCFDELVSSFFNKIYTNSRASINLAKIRDILLPKLLSGELSVENIELGEVDV